MVESSTLNANASINFQDDWIVDYGCGHHLTGDESKFFSLQPHIENEAMVIADKIVHKFENEGIVIVNGGYNNSITLDNVFHVPRMKKNLFLVSNAMDVG